MLDELRLGQKPARFVDELPVPDLPADRFPDADVKRALGLRDWLRRGGFSSLGHSFGMRFDA
jgi:hypothetical protein